MRNPKFFFLSLLALIFVALGFFINWSFFLLAIAIMLYNQKQLFKNTSKNKKDI
jgi:hypothetical protein